MFSIVFSSKFLRYKNNNVYILSENDIDNNNYDNETYFIDFNEININNVIKSNNYEYIFKIILKENDKNLLIRIDYLINTEYTELKKIMYCIEKRISGIHDFIIDNIEDDTLNKYDISYIKI